MKLISYGHTRFQGDSVPELLIVNVPFNLKQSHQQAKSVKTEVNKKGEVKVLSSNLKNNENLSLSHDLLTS